MPFVSPDKYFSRITRINVERDLLASGLRFVLLDVDNTILTRDTREIPADVREWLDHAQAAGIAFCLFSNNWHETPFQVGKELSLPVVAKAMKPLPKGYYDAYRMMGAPKNQTVAIGDQMSTDVIGAHAVGMKAFLVQPLVEQDLAHTLVIRKIERKILRNRRLDD